MLCHFLFTSRFWFFLSVTMCWCAALHENSHRCTCKHTFTPHYFLWQEPKLANYHLSKGQGVGKIKEEIAWVNFPSLSPSLPPFPSCTTCFQQISIHWYPLFFFSSRDNAPYFSWHHWHHCKSKLRGDWGKKIWFMNPPQLLICLQKSNVKDILVTFVRAVWWIQSQTGDWSLTF